MVHQRPPRSSRFANGPMRPQRRQPVEARADSTRPALAAARSNSSTASHWLRAWPPSTRTRRSCLCPAPGYAGSSPPGCARASRWSSARAESQCPRQAACASCFSDDASITSRESRALMTRTLAGSGSKTVRHRGAKPKDGGHDRADRSYRPRPRPTPRARTSHQPSLHPQLGQDRRDRREHREPAGRAWVGWHRKSRSCRDGGSPDTSPDRRACKAMNSALGGHVQVDEVNRHSGPRSSRRPQAGQAGQ
jgi:hypothetical protein